MSEQSELVEIKGYVDHFLYQLEDRGYGVFILQTEGKQLTCTGNCRDLQAGETVEITGQYVNHPVYGRQIQIRSYKVLPPANKESVERYLGSGAVKGIGPKMAARIVKEFGDDTMHIIENEPERLAEIKGISLKKAMEIAVCIEEKRDLRDAMLFLSQYKISQNLCVKIYETYGQELYNVMRENPYRLAEDVEGVGFQTADKIALESGTAVDSPFRIRCGILYTLQQAVAEGHCYLPLKELANRGGAILGTESVLFENEVEAMVFEQKIIVREDKAYLPLYYYAELNCARLLHERNLQMQKMSDVQHAALESKMQKIAAKQGMEVDPLQLEAACACANNGVFILTGGPGTGKTTTINLAIRYFLDQGLTFLLAAPTGRAAKRMSEATGYEAKTIHRLLEIGGGVEDEGRPFFQKNEDSPLEVDAVIIDEMSMVDLLLFYALLKAITPGTRLILVGDVDQLPSVGAGQVLRDLTGSDAFPCIRLQQIFRQAMDSDIIQNAHKINRGEEIRLDTNSKDFLFLERRDERTIREIMAWMIRDKLPAYCKATQMDIQVLTPMRKGALGCQELNQYLQDQLNPAAPGKAEHMVGDTLLREGDKVMQIRNNYKLEWTISGLHDITIDSGLGVFNGDMGRIQSINTLASELVVEFDDHRRVTYSFQGLDELELAYAITIHKSQGSEYPAVVMPLLDAPTPLRYRNLLYTGITRAKSCVVLLGSSNLVRNMVANVGENRRYTTLEKQIRDFA